MVFLSQLCLMVDNVMHVSEVLRSRILTIEARLAGLSHASEQFGSRTMYNATNMMIEKPEIDALSESQIEGVVILGFNMQDPSVKA